MRTINDRGIAFSFDLLLACIALFTILYLVTANSDSDAALRIEQSREIQLKKNAIFFMDSLVKNSDGNYFNGAAIYDSKRKRVLENELSLKLLSKAKEARNNEFVLRKLEVIRMSGGSSILLSKPSNKAECISLGRFVLVDGEKSVVYGVVCSE